MKIAIIAPPFTPIPPRTYGGVELFVDVLSRHLVDAGHDVVLYANGDSSTSINKRFVFRGELGSQTNNGASHSLIDMHHIAWAVDDAASTCDIIHLNSPLAVPFALFSKVPMLCTLHHPHVSALRDHYLQNNLVAYVSLSEHQRAKERPLETNVIYHGIDTQAYGLVEQKAPYLSWLGRICPLKGTHLAIQVARSMAIPLKLAGDVQPKHRQYFEEMVQPHIDGEFIQYLGEVDLAAKTELLGGSVALLFPVGWEEPFGLVMVEAMACGTPVIALGNGAVNEIVDDGVTGFVCDSVDQMHQRVLDALKLEPQSIRSHAITRFSGTRMAADYLEEYEMVLSKKRGN